VNEKKVVFFCPKIAATMLFIDGNHESDMQNKRRRQDF
jgi:hypothetical protein